MDFLKKTQPYAHLFVWPLAIAWFFSGCSLIEHSLRRLDKNYSNYQIEEDQYNRKIEESNKIIVYKTRTGTRYHRAYHYRTRNYSVLLGEAIINGYTPCRVCRPVNPGPDVFNPPIYHEPWWVSLSKFVTWIAGLYSCFWLYTAMNSDSKS